MIDRPRTSSDDASEPKRTSEGKPSPAKGASKKRASKSAPRKRTTKKTTKKMTRKSAPKKRAAKKGTTQRRALKKSSSQESATKKSVTKKPVTKKSVTKKTGAATRTNSLPPAARSELASLLEREVEIEAILGEKRVPLGDLSGTAVGNDLLLLARGEPVRLMVGSIEIGEGTTVEIEGRLALRIDRVRSAETLAAELGGWLRQETEAKLEAPGDSPDGSTDRTERVPLQSRADRG